SRLPRGRHRRALRVAALRPRGRRRPPILGLARRALRDRLHLPRGRRAGVDVLPPRRARLDGRRRRRAEGRRAGRPRRPDGPRDRAAPPPPARRRDRVAAAGAVVPVLRRPGGRAANPHPGVRPHAAASGSGLRGRAGRARDACRPLHAGGVVSLRFGPEPADIQAMGLRFPAFVPRLVGIVLLALGATATLTFAAGRGIGSLAPTTAASIAPPTTVLVPDVRNQAFVFAKG